MEQFSKRRSKHLLAVADDRLCFVVLAAVLNKLFHIVKVVPTSLEQSTIFLACHVQNRFRPILHIESTFHRGSYGILHHTNRHKTKVAKYVSAMCPNIRQHHGIAERIEFVLPGCRHFAPDILVDFFPNGIPFFLGFRFNETLNQFRVKLNVLELRKPSFFIHLRPSPCLFVQVFHGLCDGVELSFRGHFIDKIETLQSLCGILCVVDHCVGNVERCDGVSCVHCVVVQGDTHSGIELAGTAILHGSHPVFLRPLEAYVFDLLPNLCGGFCVAVNHSGKLTSGKSILHLGYKIIGRDIGVHQCGSGLTGQATIGVHGRNFFPCSPLLCFRLLISTFIDSMELVTRCVFHPGGKVASKIFGSCTHSFRKAVFLVDSSLFLCYTVHRRRRNCVAGVA